VRGMQFALTCWDCGGDTMLVAPGNPSAMLSQAVVGCCACHRQFIVTAQITPISTRSRHPGEGSS